MKIAKCILVCLVLSCVLMSISALKKKKRGLYHGLPGYSVPLGHRPYHASPYAKFPGFYKGYGGALPPGYALFPGSASVTSYQRNFPKIPAVYGSNYLPSFGVSTNGFVRPVTNLSPVAPVAPLAPAYPQVPQFPTAQFPTAQYPTAQFPTAQYPAAQYPTVQYPTAQVPAYFPLGTPQQTSFFATYPQRPIVPVAVPVPEKPKVPVVIQKPFFTAFSNGLLPNGFIPAGVYNPTVAVSNVSPTFVGVPIAGPTATTPTVSTATVPQTAQQPWRPVVFNHPTPSPSTTTAYKPSINLLPPYTLSGNGQGQIYISSTPATHVQDSQQQQQQTLLDLEQASLHHQNQDDGNGAFNGQPYDVASNHGRYSGPSSYDVDITHNGYQKK